MTRDLIASHHKAQTEAAMKSIIGVHGGNKECFCGMGCMESDGVRVLPTRVAKNIGRCSHAARAYLLFIQWYSGSQVLEIWRHGLHWCLEVVVTTKKQFGCSCTYVGMNSSHNSLKPTVFFAEHG